MPSRHSCVLVNRTGIRVGSFEVNSNTCVNSELWTMLISTFWIMPYRNNGAWSIGFLEKDCPGKKDLINQKGFFINFLIDQINF